MNKDNLFSEHIKINNLLVHHKKYGSFFKSPNLIELAHFVFVLFSKLTLIHCVTV